MSLDETRRSWSFAPSAVASTLCILPLAAFGERALQVDLSNEFLSQLCGLALDIAGFWTLVIYVGMFAEVQGFSIDRAALCTVLNVIPLILFIAAVNFLSRSYHAWPIRT